VQILAAFQARSRRFNARGSTGDWQALEKQAIFNDDSPLCAAAEIEALIVAARCNRPISAAQCPTDGLLLINHC
jgi:hypothetical protein